ncbi:MAG: hypothetical protein HQL59_09275 [Magnetococcales bacterium]|nr:hypothetical protein [Magnetococcales bacterium]
MKEIALTEAQRCALENGMRSPTGKITPTYDGGMGIPKRTMAALVEKGWATPKGVVTPEGEARVRRYHEKARTRFIPNGW